MAALREIRDYVRAKVPLPLTVLFSLVYIITFVPCVTFEHAVIGVLTQA